MHIAHDSIEARVEEIGSTSIPPIMLSMSRSGWMVFAYLSLAEARDLGTLLLDAAAAAEFDAAERVAA